MLTPLRDSRDAAAFAMGIATVGASYIGYKELRNACAIGCIAVTYTVNKVMLNALIKGIANDFLTIGQQDPIKLGLNFAASALMIGSWTSESSFFKTVLKSATLASISIISQVAYKNYQQCLDFAEASCYSFSSERDLDCMYRHMKWAEYTSYAALALNIGIAGQPLLKLFRDFEQPLHFLENFNRALFLGRRFP